MCSPARSLDTITRQLENIRFKITLLMPTRTVNLPQASPGLFPPLISNIYAKTLGTFGLRCFRRLNLSNAHQSMNDYNALLSASTNALPPPPLSLFISRSLSTTVIHSLRSYSYIYYKLSYVYLYTLFITQQCQHDITVVCTKKRTQ